MKPSNVTSMAQNPDIVDLSGAPNKVIDSHGSPLLLDIQALGKYLGRPWRSLQRQLQAPPAGFPPALRLGRRVFWSRVRVEAWLLGQPQTASEPQEGMPAVQASLVRLPKRQKQTKWTNGQSEQAASQKEQKRKESKSLLLRERISLPKRIKSLGNTEPFN